MDGMSEPTDPQDRVRSIFEMLRSSSPDEPTSDEGGAPSMADQDSEEGRPASLEAETEEPRSTEVTGAEAWGYPPAGPPSSQEPVPPERTSTPEDRLPEDPAAPDPEAAPAGPLEDPLPAGSSPSPAVTKISFGDHYRGPAPPTVSPASSPPPPPPPPPPTVSSASDAADAPAQDAFEHHAPAPLAPEGGPRPLPRIAVPADLDETLGATSPASAPEPGIELPTDEYGRSLHPGPISHQLPRILAVANQKGGVGKTTTTVNLAASLAELGYRVLVVDLDPQGNATTGLGVNGRNLDASVYDVILHDTPVEDVIEPTSLRNLFVVPATIDLAGAEIELVPVFSRELRLRRALDSVASDFDFILIDCPPSLGLLTVNALAAAGEVLVPIQCEYYALEGLSQLLRNVNLVRSNLNDALEVSTIVLTMYDARTKLAEQVASEVRTHFGRRVCRNVVPRTVRLSEAPSYGQPVTTFDSTSRGAIAYRELAKEVSGGAPQRVR
jgi:chromosome partitioning protein